MPLTCSLTGSIRSQETLCKGCAGWAPRPVTAALCSHLAQRPLLRDYWSKVLSSLLWGAGCGPQCSRKRDLLGQAIFRSQKVLSGATIASPFPLHTLGERLTPLFRPHDLRSGWKLMSAASLYDKKYSLSNSTSILLEGEMAHKRGRLKITPGHTGAGTLVPRGYSFILYFLK